ncbi:MAG: dihydroneopterin aldolase [Pedobacter sp.]|nr:MAG: dihydroneopterin aldolase [Pedobacter sp.]
MFIQTVALKEVKCYAFHGFYPEEQQTGNHFLVDVEVTFLPSSETEDIKNTVNYEELNFFILEEMKNTQKMLETVVKLILERVMVAYPFLETATVGVKKDHPSMLGEVGYSFVQLHYVK